MAGEDRAEAAADRGAACGGDGDGAVRVVEDGPSVQAEAAERRHLRRAERLPAAVVAAEPR